MAQYQVPQFIDVEDKIIGPLTLKQFLYLAFAGAVLFVLWFMLNFFIWVVVAIPVVALAAAFAFLKINDRPFAYFFMAVIGYFLKPKLYLFGTAPKPAAPKALPEKPAAAAAPAPPKKITRSRLKEISLTLDTGAGKPPESTGNE